MCNNKSSLTLNQTLSDNLSRLQSCKLSLIYTAYIDRSKFIYRKAAELMDGSLAMYFPFLFLHFLSSVFPLVEARDNILILRTILENVPLPCRKLF